MARARPILSLSRVRVRYRARRKLGWRTHEAVRGVTLEVARGECFGLVGESGCGKSTLAKAIAGLVPVHAGRVVVDGVPEGPPRTRRAALRRRVQMVFQDAGGALNPRLSVGFQLREAHGLGAHRSSPAGPAVARLLDQVGLPAETLGRHPHELSGGQRQRVVIARALLTGAEILLADEPVSALDLSVQAQILELLRQLNRDAGITCLFISHDLDVVRYLCPRVAVMFAGVIVEEGPSGTVLTGPVHPYTRTLLASIPHHMEPFTEAPVSGGPGRDQAPRAQEATGVSDDVAAPPGCPYHDRCALADMRCRAEMPPLIPLGGGHRVACFKHEVYPQSLPPTLSAS
jgi:peptide/nickel transport system ATP-binding protein